MILDPLTIDVQDDKNKGSEEVSTELLNILGEDDTTKKSVGEDIQRDIASRWEKILKTGIAKETREALIQKYPPPANCLAMDGLKLNPEIVAAVSEATLKRDERLRDKQVQLGASIASIGKALSLVIKHATEGGGDTQLVELLGDAGRMLCDIHHGDTLARRTILANGLNKNVKEVAETAPIDTWLFGDNLAERIKAAKAIERSSKDLQPVRSQITKPRPGTSGVQMVGKTRSLNWKSPSRVHGKGSHLNGRQVYKNPAARKTNNQFYRKRHQ